MRGNGTLVMVKRFLSGRRTALFIGSALLVAVALVAVVTQNASRPGRPAARASAPSASASPVPATATRLHFATLPPGSPLPSGAQCAREVRADKSQEIRPANAVFNRTVGQHVGPGLFPSGDSPQAGLLAPLISGDFTGTTEQILEWAACKWGINQDIVFAQAAAESSWQQDYFSDWTSDSATCAPGHGLGADGKSGQCPQSYGILQTKYFLWKTAWPGIAHSTAMNVDVAYAIWRSCFDGYEVWLSNSAPAGQPYHAGDVWGCLGRWYAGNWYSPAADQYINRVQTLLKEQVWEQPGFIQAAG